MNTEIENLKIEDFTKSKISKIEGKTPDVDDEIVVGLDDDDIKEGTLYSIIYEVLSNSEKRELKTFELTKEQMEKSKTLQAMFEDSKDDDNTVSVNKCTENVIKYLKGEDVDFSDFAENLRTFICASYLGIDDLMEKSAKKISDVINECGDDKKKFHDCVRIMLPEEADELIKNAEENE